jgi:hypothetical protein
MANDLYRELVSIAREYVNPFYADTLITRCCEKCGTTEDEINCDHLSAVMLAIVSDSKLLAQLTKHQFSKLMKKYMLLSNRLEEGDPDKTRKFVREQKDIKRKGEIFTGDD